MMQKSYKRRIRYIIGFMWGPMLFFFGAYAVFLRLIISVDGTVISKETKCNKHYNNRCVTTYTLKSNENSGIFTYLAGVSDDTLSSDIKVGSTIDKKRCRINYLVDGELRRDFLTWVYIPIAIFGAVLFLQGYCAYRDTDGMY